MNCIYGGWLVADYMNYIFPAHNLYGTRSDENYGSCRLLQFAIISSSNKASMKANIVAFFNILISLVSKFSTEPHANFTHKRIFHFHLITSLQHLKFIVFADILFRLLHPINSNYWLLQRYFISIRSQTIVHLIQTPYFSTLPWNRNTRVHCKLIITRLFIAQICWL